MRSCLQAAVLLGLLTAVHAESDAPPQVPSPIRAPSSEKVVLHARGTGFQIYVCQADATGKLAWAFLAPQAELHDQKGRTIGRHYGGPTWKLEDGSQVGGQLVARVEAPGSSDIPWLLLSASSHAGNGLLSSVTSIQRINTHGGGAPEEGCDLSHRGAQAKSSYDADYYFYAPAP